MILNLETFAGPGTQIVVLASLAAKRPMGIGGCVHAGPATRRAAHGPLLEACLFGVLEFGNHGWFKRKASVRMPHPLEPGEGDHRRLAA